MASYWKQNDVLGIIKDYDDCDSLLEDLLKLQNYNDDGAPDTQNITNINFICDKEKLEEILRNIAKNNDGKIAVLKEGEYNG